MKKIVYSLLLCALVPVLCSEKEPLLSKKNKKEQELINTITISKIKNQTQQTLKLIINGEVRFISRAEKTSPSVDIPLFFTVSENLLSCKDKIQITDENNNQLAKFSCIVDPSSSQEVEFIFFISIEGKRDSIARYKVKLKKTYNVTLIVSGKKNLEKLGFDFS